MQLGKLHGTSIARVSDELNGYFTNWSGRLHMLHTAHASIAILKGEYSFLHHCAFDNICSARWCFEKLKLWCFYYAFCHVLAFKVYLRCRKKLAFKWAIISGEVISIFNNLSLVVKKKVERLCQYCFDLWRLDVNKKISTIRILCMSINGIISQALHIRPEWTNCFKEEGML